jgi:DNA repair protein RadC
MAAQTAPKDGKVVAISNAQRYQPTIRDLPTGERPRERLAEYGSKHLSTTELVAILLRTGSSGENVISLSSRLLSRFGGLRGLGRAAFTELCAQKGLSEAKSCQLLAALELGRRFVSLAPEERLMVNSPEDVANLVAGEMGNLDQEHLRVIMLNTRNEVVGTDERYVGNVNTSVVRPAEVFRPAVRNNATAIVVVHNHPSGDPSPSEQDIEITRELGASGKMLGVEVLDHLVIGSGNRYVSMQETRMGFVSLPDDPLGPI